MSLSSSPPPLLEGEVIFDEQAESFSGATMYVYLNDTTMQDTAAKLVVRAVVENVSYNSDIRNSLKFSLYGSIADPNADYTVSVLIDLDGDGKAGKGDYRNKQAYHVLTPENPNTVTVQVKRL